MRRSWLYAAALATWVSGLAPAAVAQLPEGQAAGSARAAASYEQLIHDALSEFNAGNMAEARALFERAHARRPSARTLRGLGITSFELKRYVQSLTELNAALTDSRTPLTEQQRKEVDALIGRANQYVGKIQLVITPSTASVFVDDRPVAGPHLLLDLGSYRVLVHAAGYRNAELKLVVDGGENRTQRVDLLPVDVSPQSAAAAVQPGREATQPAGFARLADRGERSGSGSVFGTWWFWTGAGAVVAGGTAVALALALGARAGQEPLYKGSVGSLRGP